MGVFESMSYFLPTPFSPNSSSSKKKWAILGLFTISSPQKIIPKYMLIELFFIRARERGVRERGKVK
jgi:hypothetical protein